MKISIVLGTQYGDEGKGSTVNWLARLVDNSIVVRFNGGHQAGHTVVHNGVRHVFSSIGSGTLNGSDTFISKYCTVFPSGFNREYDILLSKIKHVPKIYVDPLAMITTPFDVDQNRSEESTNQHGSCGVGFGKTVFRHETLDHSYRIFAKDLKYEWILREKLWAMHGLFDQTGGNFNVNINQFLKDVKLYLSRVEIRDCSVLSTADHLIFEGAQGIMLDREHGIFPHVTRSHCTSKNVWEILNSVTPMVDDDFEVPKIYYITRCYQTRHGNGPLNGEGKVDVKSHLINIENETNVSNEFQGKFRYAPFYFPNIDYAVETDAAYHDRYCEKLLVVTCIDQIKNKVPVLEDNGNVDFMTKDDFLFKLKTRKNLGILPVCSPSFEFYHK